MKDGGSTSGGAFPSDGGNGLPGLDWSRLGWGKMNVRAGVKEEEGRNCPKRHRQPSEWHCCGAVARGLRSETSCGVHRTGTWIASLGKCSPGARLAPGRCEHIPERESPRLFAQAWARAVQAFCGRTRCHAVTAAILFSGQPDMRVPWDVFARGRLEEKEHASQQGRLLKTVAFRGALAGRSPRLDSLSHYAVMFPPRVYGYRQTLPRNRRDAVPTRPHFPPVQKLTRPADMKKPLRDISRRGCRQLRITPSYVNYR